MFQDLLLASCAIGSMFFLAACTAQKPTADDVPPADAYADASVPAFRGGDRQDLQQYLEAANAAADRQELTKEEFETQMQTLMEEHRPSNAASDTPAGLQPEDGNAPAATDREQPPSGGTGGLMRGPQDRLTNAATYLKYTDSDGNTVLLALDADGNVVMKLPMERGDGGPPPARQ